jgi:alkanesulfonate monooxygenase SsuD/methylene tetrahydromethanopterin reductase-like flavin-dependent oxidoreductase (luciferase family)
VRLGLTLGVMGSAPAVNLELSAAAERAGFDTLSLGEAAYDTFAYCAATATASTSVRIYAGVATWTRPPVLTALAAATVDRISGGRFVLGLGSMPRAWNEDWYGIGYQRPLARMREYVEVVRGALLAHSGRALDHEGERFRVRGYRRMEPPLRDDIPIHLAATRTGMARLAGEVADGVLFNFIHSAGWIRDVVGPAVTGGEARSGRRVERGVMVRCAIGDDGERERRVLAASFLNYLEIPYLEDLCRHHGWDLRPARARLAAGDRSGAIAAIPPALVEASAVAGTAAQCRAQLRRYEGLVDWVLLTPPMGRAAGESAAYQRTIIEQLGGVA